jgi:hypothetical protein
LQRGEVIFSTNPQFMLYTGHTEGMFQLAKHFDRQEHKHCVKLECIKRHKKSLYPEIEEEIKRRLASFFSLTGFEVIARVKERASSSSASSSSFKPGHADTNSKSRSFALRRSDPQKLDVLEKKIPHLNAKLQCDSTSKLLISFFEPQSQITGMDIEFVWKVCTFWSSQSPNCDWLFSCRVFSKGEKCRDNE